MTLLLALSYNCKYMHALMHYPNLQIYMLMHGIENTEYWIQDTGYWILDTGNRILNTGVLWKHLNMEMSQHRNAFKKSGNPSKHNF